MSNNIIELLENKRAVLLKVNGSSRKTYAKPHLVTLGDLRNLTLGGSPGTFDSGCSYPTCTTQSSQGHHGPLIKPQGIIVPGSYPPETPMPDNPFLPPTAGNPLLP